MMQEGGRAEGWGEIVLQDAWHGRWLHFRSPERVIECRTVEEVLPALARIEEAVNRHGLHAAGFIGYEASPAFDPAMRVRAASLLPLLWFGLYTAPRQLEDLPQRANGDYQVGQWRPSVDRVDYERSIDRIKEYIGGGFSYQVNYTFNLRAPFEGDPWSFYQQLVQAQLADYTAYIDIGSHTICSASPELFFRLDGDTLTSKPMKGTAPRGRTSEEDERQREWLQHSEKNRAENVMIVDMIRNDMGRIAEVGTVHVPRLFEIERYPTLFQMTSTVCATTHASLVEILRALFPCASITGAPKIRTMEIITELEPEPRGLYTGTIGFLSPGRQAQFNVAIRTVTIDRRAREAEYGVGGGIVWDSDGAEEYEECRTKARVLMESPPAFELLESIRWRPDEGYFLLDRHLRRLVESARYFDIPCDGEIMTRRLKALEETLNIEPCKVRLLLSRQGELSLEVERLAERAKRGPLTVTLAVEPVNSDDPFLYHKTTNRNLYERARAARPGYDDVLLWNQRGELTEFTIGNLVLRLNGELVTPPVSSGLLPGVYRDWLLARGLIREVVLTREDLARCERIYLVNSVREWVEVRLRPVPQAEAL